MLHFFLTPGFLTMVIWEVVILLPKLFIVWVAATDFSSPFAPPPSPPRTRSLLPIVP